MIKINQNGDTSKEILRIKALHKGEYKDIQKIYDLNGNLIFKNYNEISGNPPISFKSDGSNLLDYTIFGNTIQNSTPAPDTPIYSAGVGDETENLIPLQDKSFTLKGVTITCKNGRIYFTGMPNSEVVNKDIPTFQQYFGFELPTGTYNLIGESNPNFLNTSIWKDNGDGSYTILASIFSSTRTATFVINEDNTKVCLKFYYYRNTIIPGTPMEIMVCREEVTEYEPYGYKIPTICGYQTNNIYITEPLHKIGNYADEINYSTGKIIRRIKKLVLTGDDNFNWKRSSTRNYSWYFRLSDINAKQHFFYCSHGRTTYTEPSFVYGCVFVDSVLNFGIFGDYSQISQVHSHLAAEYEKGTPVTIWYVLAESEEETIEMPEISTIKGSNIIDVGTTVKPSQIGIKYKK